MNIKNVRGDIFRFTLLFYTLNSSFLISLFHFMRFYLVFVLCEQSLSNFKREQPFVCFLPIRNVRLIKQKLMNKIGSLKVLKVSIKMFCVDVIYFVLHHCNEVYGIIFLSDAEFSRCISSSFESNSRNRQKVQYESYGFSVSQVHAVVSSILYSLLR